MEVKVDRLVDYFAVVGLGDHLQPNNSEKESDRKITSLEILVGYVNIDPETLGSTSERWVDLDGSKTVWLKISFDQPRPAVTKFGLYRIPLDKENHLLLPRENALKPVLIKKLSNKGNEKEKIAKMTQTTIYYEGNYDLTYYLGGELKQNFSLVLCYKEQGENNFKPALCDIKITELQKSPFGTGLTVVLPKSYKARKFRFGRKDKNRILAYRKCSDLDNIQYAPSVLNRYPLNNYEDLEFPAAIALFCFPHGISLSRSLRTPHTFAFILTQQDGARTYGACLTFDEEFPVKSLRKLGHVKVDSQNPLYVQKAICITSSYPFQDQLLEFLRQLYRLHLSKCEIPIERYISNFVDEAPLPERGGTAVSYEIGSTNLLFKLPGKFPLLSEQSITTLFTLLSLNHITTLIEFVLLERKIFLISKYKSTLTQVAEAITGLIYPFVWTHVLIPILPDNLLAYIEAPVPFVIGIHSMNGQDDLALNLGSDVVKVYLDSDSLIYTDNIPSLPEKPFKHLIKRLEPFSQMHDNWEAKLQDCDEAFRIRLLDAEEFPEEFDTFEIRDAFFEFMIYILKYCPKCFQAPKTQKNSVELGDIFDIKEFLALNKSTKQGSFVFKMTETCLFSYFIETRVMGTPTTEEYQLIDLAFKNAKAKKKPIFIGPFLPTQITKTIPPNNQGLPPEIKYFQYQVFPILHPELFSPPRLLHKVVSKHHKSISLVEPDDHSNPMDDNQWAQIMLDNLYTLWFWILGMKACSKQQNYFPKITERGLSLLDHIVSKGFEPNGTILKGIIQACCASSMTSKALEIVSQVQERKSDALPHAHGVYLEAVARAKGCDISYFKGESPLKLTQGKKSDSPRTVSSKNLEEKKIEEKSDKDKGSIVDTDSMSDTMSRDNNVPYAFFIKIVDCIKKTEDDKINPDDILRAWKQSLEAYNNHEEKEIKRLKIVIEEHKDRKILKHEFEWICPIILRNRLEHINHKEGESMLLSQKFSEKYPDLYWNLIIGAQIIKAPSLFFEYYQNPYSIAEALRVMEFEEATKPQKPSSIVDHVTTFIKTNSDIFKPGERKVFIYLNLL